jgi:hypothetical protein
LVFRGTSGSNSTPRWSQIDFKLYRCRPLEGFDKEEMWCIILGVGVSGQEVGKVSPGKRVGVSSGRGEERPNIIGILRAFVCARANRVAFMAARAGSLTIYRTVSPDEPVGVSREPPKTATRKVPYFRLFPGISGYFRLN